MSEEAFFSLILEVRALWGPLPTPRASCPSLLVILVQKLQVAMTPSILLNETGSSKIRVWGGWGPLDHRPQYTHVCTQEELEWAEEQFQSRKTLTALIAGQGDCTAPVELSWQFLKNSKSPHDPVIPQPGLHPRELKLYICATNLYINALRSIIHNGKKKKKGSHPMFINKEIDKM